MLQSVTDTLQEYNGSDSFLKTEAVWSPKTSYLHTGLHYVRF